MLLILPHAVTLTVPLAQRSRNCGQRFATEMGALQKMSLTLHPSSLNVSQLCPSLDFEPFEVCDRTSYTDSRWRKGMFNEDNGHSFTITPL
jgi:hypothetical protein